MFMRNDQLAQLVRCPRCREQIPLTREYTNQTGLLGCFILFGGCPVVQSLLPINDYQTPENTLFFPTVVGTVADPERCVRNSEGKHPVRVQRKSNGKVSAAQFNTDWKCFSPDTRVLGLTFDE